MVNKSILLVLVAFLLSSSTYSDELVYWQPNKLSWDSFKVTQKSDEGFDALLASGIQITTTDHAGTLSITVRSYVDPSESWVVSGAQTNRLLRHEQLHFDITELSRRKLVLALITASGITSDNLDHQVDSLFEEAMQRQETMSNNYDSETRHGLNLLQQQKWELQIAAELREYESLSQESIEIN